VKPPLSYYGGKTSLARRIADLLPRHRHYVEPFAGSLAVLLAKPPSVMETVNDLDQALVTFWRVLRERPAELAHVCALTPHARVEHRAAYEPVPAPATPEGELEAARRVWVLLTQGRTGTMRRTGWRHFINPGGSGMSMPGYLAAYTRRLAPAAQRLMRVSLECRPALEIIHAYGAHAGVLLYVDPPYLGETRGGTSYRHEMPRPAQHAELAAALNDVRATVVLSGYPSDLYSQLYRDWYRHDIPHGTGQSGTWSNRTECLWSNRPLATPTQLIPGDETLFASDAHGIASDETPPTDTRRCGCGRSLPPSSAVGRPPRHCSPACRQAAYRQRRHQPRPTHEGTAA
jgi:DNA adenine methylase